MFGDSLKYVNRLYNNTFGPFARKVQAHMPHMINRRIMEELQAKWSEQWDATSSHSLRSSTDMQYGFAYMYYVIHARQEYNFSNVWIKDLDRNLDGYINKNELRTIAAILYGTPVKDSSLADIQNRLIDECLKMKQANDGNMVGIEKIPDGWDEFPGFDNNDDRWCIITKEVFTAENKTMNEIQKHYSKKAKYRHQIEGTDDVAFLMIGDDRNTTQGKLDGIRVRRQKFVCLNDNMNHSDPASKEVVAVLKEFYESLLPQPSAFELPSGVRNTYLYMDELIEARRLARLKRQYTYLIGIAMVFLFLVFIYVCRRFTKDYDRRTREKRAKKFLSV